VSRRDRYLTDVLEQRRLPEPVAADEDDIVRRVDEVESQNAFHRLTVESPEVLPLKFIERLEGPQLCATPTPFEASFGAKSALHVGDGLQRLEDFVTLIRRL
jgi:hypothetical protein